MCCENEGAMKESIKIVRTRISDTKSEKDSSKVERRKTVTDYSLPENRNALVRQAIIEATAIFANQEVFTGKSVDTSKEDQALVDALLQWKGDPKYMGAMKVLTEAIVGRKLVIPNATPLRYNMLAAFVPLCPPTNGHNYPVDVVSVSITGNANGNNSVRTDQLTQGNAPPPDVTVNGVKTIRPATATEIIGLSDKIISAIDGTTKLTFVPVGV